MWCINECTLKLLQTSRKKSACRTVINSCCRWANVYKNYKIGKPSNCFWVSDIIKSSVLIISNHIGMYCILLMPHYRKKYWNTKHKEILSSKSLQFWWEQNISFNNKNSHYYPDDWKWKLVKLVVFNAKSTPAYYTNNRQKCMMLGWTKLILTLTYNLHLQKMLIPLV